MRAAGLGLVVAAFSLQAAADAQHKATTNGHGLAYPRQRGSDYDYTSFPQDQQERADAVIEQFRFAWDGYYKYAYPHDSLQPANNTYRDDRNGWGLTMVDALDTAIIMEQQDIVDIILKFIPTIDFTKNNAEQNKVFPAVTPVTTSLFETNIRYLGGLMGAYDLLKGPFKNMVKNDSQVDALLSQAVSLADTLKFCFDTPSGIPVNMVFIDNQTFTDLDVGDDGIQYAGIAVFGTLVLEWQHLSDLTGDPSYGALAQRAEAHWFNAKEVWPGLTGGLFSIQNGSVVDDYGGWTSGNDSAYEYLIKMYAYDPERYGNYSERWQAAADSTIKHLLSSPNSRPDLTMAGTFAGRVVQNSSQQLACFIGGNFLLGSTIYGREDYLDAGLKFSEFCANGYRYTASGIGPVLYSWNETILADADYANQTDQYERAGWFIDENLAFSGGQTPEAIESWYYAYQTTGDQYWRDVAWAYTVAQNQTLRVGSGFASIRNVYRADGGGTGNYMASFMLAETLKYQFMIQSPKDGEWNVQHGEDKKNLFVYNTEAHPFKVASRKPVVKTFHVDQEDKLKVELHEEEGQHGEEVKHEEEGKYEEEGKHEEQDKHEEEGKHEEKGKHEEQGKHEDGQHGEDNVSQEHDVVPIERPTPSSMQPFQPSGGGLLLILFLFCFTLAVVLRRPVGRRAVVAGQENHEVYKDI